MARGARQAYNYDALATLSEEESLQERSKEATKQTNKFSSLNCVALTLCLLCMVVVSYDLVVLRRKNIFVFFYLWHQGWFCAVCFHIYDFLPFLEKSVQFSSQKTLKQFQCSSHTETAKQWYNKHSPISWSTLNPSSKHIQCCHSTPKQSNPSVTAISLEEFRNGVQVRNHLQLRHNNLMSRVLRTVRRWMDPLGSAANHSCKIIQLQRYLCHEFIM